MNARAEWERLPFGKPSGYVCAWKYAHVRAPIS